MSAQEPWVVVLKRNFVLVLILASEMTWNLFHLDHQRNHRRNRSQKKNRQQTQHWCQNQVGHIGYSVSLSLVRACWLCWRLWHCFTRIIITLAEPKSGLWRGGCWHLKVHLSLHRGIKNTTRSMHHCSCRRIFVFQCRVTKI